MDIIWSQLKDRVVTLFGRLESVASSSYQINMEVKSQQLAKLFDAQT